MSVGNRHGLTLVEVAIALAILACTVVAATSILAQARGVRLATQSDDDGRVLVENELERLRALPYWSEVRKGSEPDHFLVGALFPHAIASRNTESHYFVARAQGSDPAGAFVSSHVLAEGSLRVVAQFAVSSRDGWRALGSGEIEGFACDQAWRPPSTTMIISVGFSSGSSRASASPQCEQHAVIVAQHGDSATSSGVPGPTNFAGR